ncbi:MAG TPA: glycoside hydrolase family 15 protein [Polyangia bacterium]
MKRAALALLALFAISFGGAHALAAPQRSFNFLTTGNGYGFAVFDIGQNKLVRFLERPYRYLSPGADPHGTGIEARNLAYDVYFGARVGSSGAWMKDLPPSAVGYVDQTGTIQSVSTLAGVRIESDYFSPFGYDGNLMVMRIVVTNNSGAPTAVDVFANPNFHLGTATDPSAPGADGESITSAAGLFSETGPGGGAMVYLPVGGIDRADCSGTGFARVQAGQDLAGTPESCSGNDLTEVFQKSLGTLAPGQSASWGLAIAFAAGGNATAAQSAWTTFLAGRSIDQLFSDVQSEWQAWRKPPPAGLAPAELRVFRQAEAVLRMAQVREAWSSAPKHKARGMILASLPPGQWNIGWVRDATYAIVALTRLHHFAEAKLALDFFLDAEADKYQAYAGVPYRISVCRYFGDGQEESDWNADGPNIELDGWGLYLWAARTYLDASGDLAWLAETTRAGEPKYTVLRDLIAAPLAEHNLDTDGLVNPDTSIWESHWNRRKHYAYTSLAAARGLCDFSSIARSDGDSASAGSYAKTAASLPSAIRAHLVDGTGMLGGSVEGIAGGTYHDGAVLAGINWDLYPPGDPLVGATLDGLAKLKVASGGYMRNDDGLSSYDSSEWIMIDLQMAAAERRAGRVAQADALLGLVTAQGDANNDLLPELLNTDPSAGPIASYAGAVPMVGFGAAGYILALLDRSGAAPERRDCGQSAADGGVTDGGADGGTLPPKLAPGCGCALGGGPIPAPLALLFCGGLVALFALRHAVRGRGAGR